MRERPKVRGIRAKQHNSLDFLSNIGNLFNKIETTTLDRLMELDRLSLPDPYNPCP